MGSAARIDSPLVRSKKPSRGETWKPVPLRLTADFLREPNAVTDLYWRDERNSISSRAQAWVKRHSWGYNVLEAIIPTGKIHADGSWSNLNCRPATQSDIAKHLKIQRSHVSEAIADQKRRGYLEDRNDALLQPALRPI